MKKIRKTYNGTVPNNKIVNSKSNSTTDTYSCDYINKIFSEIEYTTEGLTTNYTIQSGGYCRIGNIVIVDIKVGKPASTGNTTLVSGLPIPINNTVAITVINSTDGSNTFIYGAVDSQGQIRINCPTANKNYSVSGVYICQNS